MSQVTHEARKNAPTQDVERGQVVAEYTTELISSTEASKCKAEYARVGKTCTLMVIRHRAKASGKFLAWVHFCRYFFTASLLVLIKIIIVKLLLQIATLKIQSDYFGIKRSRKCPADCSIQQPLHIYYHNWRWNVIKERKFQHLWLIKKSLKCGYLWVLLSLYNIQDFILLAWGPHLEDFNI